MTNSAASTTNFRRPLAVALLVAYGQACFSWRTLPVAPEAFPASDPPSVVRVTLTDRSRLELTSARIAQDTLWGVDTRSENPVTVALAQVQRLEAMHFSAGKTVGLTLGVLVVAGGVVTIIALQGLGEN